MADLVHYGPEHTEGLPPWRRRALCGVVYEIGGSLREPALPEGSSRLEEVTCCDCFDVLEARKRIQEAANG